MRVHILLVLLLLFPASLAAAIEEETDAPELKSVFSPSRIAIGDRVSYMVTAAHSPDQTVSFALPDSTRLMPYVLVHQEVTQPEKGIAVLNAELAVFDIGEYQLPAVTVVFHGSPGDEKTVRTTPGGSIVVEALTDSAMTDLLPIKPVKQPYRPWTEYLSPVFVFVAVTVTVILIRLFMKRRTELLCKPVDFRKGTLRKVGKLEKNLEKGLRPEECYEQLSFLIREYLEGEYRIKALEKVTREIGDELEGRAVPHADILIGLLSQADLVKFAESRPVTNECRVSLDQAKAALKG